MTPRQKWLLVSFALWVVPGLVFWAGYFGWERSTRETARLARVGEATAFLERAIAAGDPLRQRSADWSRAFRRWRRTGRPPRPSPGSPPCTVLLFDGAGRLRWPGSSPAVTAGIERWFAWARSPLLPYQPLPADLFGEAGALVFNPRDTALVMRTHGGGRLWNTRQGLARPEERRQVGFWWSAAPPGDRAGLVVIQHAGRPDAGRAWKRVAAAARRMGRGLGFHLPDGRFQAPPGLASGAFLAGVERYRREPGQVFPLPEGSLVVQETPDGDLLAALVPPPPEPAGVRLAIAALFAAASLYILYRLYMLFIHGSSLPLPLGGKLVVLLALGVGFPLGLAGVVGQAWLAGAEASLVEEAHREGLSFLEQVDAGFESFAARRGLVYGRRLGERRRPRPPIARTLAGMRDMLDRFVVLEAYLIGSTSKVLLADTEPWNRTQQRAARAGPARRPLVLQEWMRRGWSPAPHEWDLFGPDPQDYRRQPRRSTWDYYVRLVRTFQAATRNMIEYADSLAGAQGGPPPAAPPQASLDGLLGEEFVRILRGMRSYLFRCRIMETPLGAGMLYSTVLTDELGRGQYLAVLSHDLDSFQATYLRLVFRRFPAHRGETSWKALYLPSHEEPSFPEIDDPAMTEVFRREVQGTGASTRTFQRAFRGREFLVTLRPGTRVRDYLLVHLTPRRVVDRRLAAHRRRIWGTLAGASLFGMLLAVLFLGRVLMPLEAVAAGIRALRERRPVQALTAHATDELGVLCGEFNKTVELLREMEVAAMVQRHLLPPAAVTAGRVTACGLNRMTQAVGGDFYDFLPLPGGALAVVMGDVSGHGISAALVTAMAKAGFTLLCPRHPDDPGAVLREMHQAFLTLLGKRKMMTCWLGCFDPTGAVLRCANAGQTYPVLVGSDGTVEELAMPSTPLGIGRKAPYPTRIVDLAGRSVFVYSDCLVESRDPTGTMVGFDRLVGVLCQALRDRPADPLPAVLERVEAITRPVPWDDDATLVLVRTDRRTLPAPP
ncbi:MAG: serine/threonine-protein phosphatase [Candidatus Riflebacteria bacterium]|nr:serine/threonine-protein phosphatase [Candidatus Riflebacteria bacterium]